MRSPSTTPERTRVAYLIISHTLPAQVLRLAAVLRTASPDAALIVHHDERSCVLDADRLAALRAVRVEPPSRVEWGEISQLEMVLRCLRWALEHVAFDWLVVLSGQDYPIRPIADVERSLALADCDAFARTRACTRRARGAPIDEFSRRYYFRWRRTGSRSLAAGVSWLARRGLPVASSAMPSGTWIGVRALRSPFGSDFACHVGPDWFYLSRAAATAVERFAARWPSVLGYYGRTLHPNESFIQSVLANDPNLRLSADNRRYSVWDAPRMSGPRVLRLGDLDAMLGSGGDFARKFDETVDGAVLDEIDRRVHSIGALPPAS